PSKSKRKGVEVSSSPLRTGDQLEEHCLALLLNYPGLRNAIGELTADHFERSENKEVFMALYNSRDGDNIMKKLDTSLHEHFNALAGRKHPPADRSKQEQELIQCIRRLEVRRHQVALAAEKDIEENSSKLTQLWHQSTITSR
ncbi:MAG: hypothetical protein SVM79_05245, partial [Chloroflexota bacterium]|nr:hypothetical protein [Chloroflexota bacterium]